MAAPKPSKPWSIASFESHRPHLTEFVRRDLLPLLETADCVRIVVRAPVKSGKREIVEYIAMRDSSTNSPRVHAFLSAWHRKADDEQREELKHHNLRVFSITKQKEVSACISWIMSELAKGKQIVLHLDECDHGSGGKQMLSKVWAQTRDTTSVTNILYSATPEEVLFSGEVDDPDQVTMTQTMLYEGHRVKYNPPSGYCGPARFLEAGLVTEAKPFFYKSHTGFHLSDQGKEIITNLRQSLVENPNRNIVVLRLSYSDLGGTQAERKQNKALYQFLNNLNKFPELNDMAIIADKGDYSGDKQPNMLIQKIEWSSDMFWKLQATAVPTIIVIDQTSSRSTEWACHNRIFATHDFRNMVQYTTISQAQERVNHYEQRYGGFQQIRVYGHRKTFLLSAEQIDYKTYLTNDWIRHKVDKRTAGDENLYRVKRVATGVLHPSCPSGGMVEAVADMLLQDLGCFADVSISARVIGRPMEKRVYTAKWAAVTPETWETWWPTFRTDVPEGYNPRNPFLAAAPYRLPDGRWRGQHRGWAVLDFDADIKESPDLGSTGGNRIKICYRGGVLGIAVVICTGVEQVDTMRTYKSMYVSS